MLELILEKYPLQRQLNDGSDCTVRLMKAADETAFRDFHDVIPDRDQLFIKNRIKDGSLFRQWMTEPQVEEFVPLLAFVGQDLAAIGVLGQRLGGWKRHIGKLYFLTHPAFTGRGLIDLLRDEIVDVSRHCGLTRLESELNGERRSAIESMAAVGFRELLRLPNYIQDMQAEYHDYVLMGMDLIPEYENLGAGD
jgi:GNAT superfamily N-acetyltransferase